MCVPGTDKEKISGPTLKFVWLEYLGAFWRFNDGLICLLTLRTEAQELGFGFPKTASLKHKLSLSLSPKGAEVVAELGWSQAFDGEVIP